MLRQIFGESVERIRSGCPRSLECPGSGWDAGWPACPVCGLASPPGTTMEHEGLLQLRPFIQKPVINGTWSALNSRKHNWVAEGDGEIQKHKDENLRMICHQKHIMYNSRIEQHNMWRIILKPKTKAQHKVLQRFSKGTAEECWLLKQTENVVRSSPTASQQFMRKAFKTLMSTTSENTLNIPSTLSQKASKKHSKTALLGAPAAAWWLDPKNRFIRSHFEGQRCSKGGSPGTLGSPKGFRIHQKTTKIQLKEIGQQKVGPRCRTCTRQTSKSEDPRERGSNFQEVHREPQRHQKVT